MFILTDGLLNVNATGAYFGLFHRCNYIPDNIPTYDKYPGCAKQLQRRAKALQARAQDPEDTFRVRLTLYPEV